MKARRPLSRGRGRGGFTLVEIMIVVAILGLTMVIGFPSFVNMRQKTGMRKAQSDLQEACRDARRTAIMTARTANLVFHPQEGTFDTEGFHAEFPKDITIEIMGVNFIQCENADEATVRFNPNGTSDEFTIVIRGGNGETMKLSLEPITALAVVEQLR